MWDRCSKESETGNYDVDDDVLSGYVKISVFFVWSMKKLDTFEGYLFD